MIVMIAIACGTLAAIAFSVSLAMLVKIFLQKWRWEEMKAIVQYTASGQVLTSEEIQKRNELIKSEVIKSLHGYDLTIGQAIELLQECQNDLMTTAYGRSL